MQTSYNGRISHFISEMANDPIKVDNTRLANEFLDKDYKFRRNRAHVLNKSF